MTREPRYHRKGSVIVMVVGLLTMLAMIATTFIIVAHMDRREAHSIATAAPMKQVAGGVLQQIRVKLAEDLYFDAATGAIIYGKTNINYQEQVEFPHEEYDKHLASFAPVLVSGASTWRHISNHNDIGVFADVAANDASLVDTDGYLNDGTNPGDAKLFNSGVSNRVGKEYYVAYRLIDASSLMNVNSAYGPPAAAAAGTVMPVTNISLEALTNAATRNSVHNTRRGDTATDIADYNTRYIVRPLNPNPPGGTAFLPFDASDMTALLWGGTDTESGRLWEALGGQFIPAKPYLTVFSSSRDYVRQVSGGVNEAMTDNRRVDMNTAGFADLFKAFYNSIPTNVPGFPAGNAGRRAIAAQLAVNVIDYRDANNDVTVKTVPGPGPALTVFGIERQPFITEAWLRMEWDGAVPPGSVKQWSAIELFNPYKTPVSLAGYQLKVGANPDAAIPGLPANISAGGRIVIVSNTAEIQAVTKYQDANLDLREPCTLLRPSGGSLVPVGSVGIGDFVGLTAPSGPADPPVFAAIRRDDAVARAKYSVAVYKPYNTVTYLIGEGGCPAAALTNLGRSNVDPFGTGADDAVLAALAVAPTPVFVRNGNLINLGEASRIFYVGPQSDGTPLDEVLKSSANDVDNGRLYTFGDIRASGWANPDTPDIPPICMLGDYMDVLVPSTDNAGRTDTIYGRININTAPWQVIRYLPGISAMAQRDLIAQDIVAYRDLLDNTVTPGGTNYSVAAGTRAAITGLADLRPEAGFASPGEIAIPLAKITSLNNNYGASAPNCYRVAAGSDDGLDDITDDLSKYDIYYAWLSNQITVRSDVYIAYIRVQIDSDPNTTNAVRRYVAVIDRSNCTSSNDLPDVLMFAEMK